MRGQFTTGKRNCAEGRPATPRAKGRGPRHNTAPAQPTRRAVGVALAVGVDEMDREWPSAQIRAVGVAGPRHGAGNGVRPATLWAEGGPRRTNGPSAQFFFSFYHIKLRKIINKSFKFTKIQIIYQNLQKKKFYLSTLKYYTFVKKIK